MRSARRFPAPTPGPSPDLRGGESRLHSQGYSPPLALGEGPGVGAGAQTSPYGFSGASNTRISDTPGGVPTRSVALITNRRPVVVTPSGKKKSGLGTPNGTKTV